METPYQTFIRSHRAILSENFPDLAQNISQNFSHSILPDDNETDNNLESIIHAASAYPQLLRSPNCSNLNCTNLNSSNVNSLNNVNVNPPPSIVINPSDLMTMEEREQSRKAVPSLSKISMLNMENRINESIGYNWWKKYISAAFWSNISAPVNICITIFTALTTGELATSTVLSSATTIGLTLTTLVLSTINTFFHPYKKMTSNIDEMNKWQDIGSKFETVYFSNNFDDFDFERRLTAYEGLQKEIHHLCTLQASVTEGNFLTDLIHFIAGKTCLKRERWIISDTSTSHYYTENSV